MFSEAQEELQSQVMILRRFRRPSCVEESSQQVAASLRRYSISNRCSILYITVMRPPRASQIYAAPSHNMQTLTRWHPAPPLHQWCWPIFALTFSSVSYNNGWRGKTDPTHRTVANFVCVATLLLRSYAKYFPTPAVADERYTLKYDCINVHRQTNKQMEDHLFLTLFSQQIM